MPMSNDAERRRLAGGGKRRRQITVAGSGRKFDVVEEVDEPRPSPSLFERYQRAIGKRP